MKNQVNITDSPEFVYRFLDKNPNAVFSDYKKAFPSTLLDTHIFGQRKYFYRKRMKGRDRQIHVIHKINKTAPKNLTYEDSNEFICAYLTIDPNKSYSDLKKDFPHSRMKAGTFYSRKHWFKKNNGIPVASAKKRSYSKRKNNNLYMTVWEYSLDGIPESQKKIVRDAIEDFVNTVAESGRVNWQIVELLNPHKLELREIGK